MDIDPIIAALRIILAFVVTIAKYTVTKVDDTIAEVLTEVLANEQLIAMVKAIAGDLDVQALNGQARTDRIMSLAAAAAPQIEQELAGKVDWKKLLESLPTIIRLLLTFTGKR